MEEKHYLMIVGAVALVAIVLILTPNFELNSNDNLAGQAYRSDVQDPINAFLNQYDGHLIGKVNNQKTKFERDLAKLGEVVYVNKDNTEKCTGYDIYVENSNTGKIMKVASAECVGFCTERTDLGDFSIPCYSLLKGECGCGLPENGGTIVANNCISNIAVGN